MTSRLRKAYVAAEFYELAHRWAGARHSEAAAARQLPDPRRAPLGSGDCP
jgi:hypothetical protein